ncbi:MAG: YabP/YqfC family sporulation protein [Clostridiales bacterium]|jgi:sporulation protein YqfC|nr:YabP/YqfC family sporulation protein [Clostridiales bacterium]
MVFLEDLKDKLNADELGGCKIIIFDGGIYVEGHRGVCEFGGERIVFLLKKRRLVIIGCGFKLTCLSYDSASVKGKLNSLSFEK